MRWTRTKKIDHEQYERKYQLLTEHDVERAALYRWVVDLAVVRLAISGKVSLEELSSRDIDFEETLGNVKLRDCETY